MCIVLRQNVIVYFIIISVVPRFMKLVDFAMSFWIAQLQFAITHFNLMFVLSHLSQLQFVCLDRSGRMWVQLLYLMTPIAIKEVAFIEYHFLWHFAVASWLVFCVAITQFFNALKIRTQNYNNNYIFCPKCSFQVWTHSLAE